MQKPKKICYWEHNLKTTICPKHGCPIIECPVKNMVIVPAEELKEIRLFTKPLKKKLGATQF